MLISINITFITLIYSYSETYKCSVTYEQKNIHFFIINVKLKMNICCFLTRFFTKEVDILCVSHIINYHLHENFLNETMIFY